MRSRWQFPVIVGLLLGVLGPLDARADVVLIESLEASDSSVGTGSLDLQWRPETALNSATDWTEPDFRPHVDPCDRARRHQTGGATALVLGLLSGAGAAGMGVFTHRAVIDGQPTEAGLGAGATGGLATLGGIGLFGGLAGLSHGLNLRDKYQCWERW